MTHEEYLVKVREALAKLDKTDKEAVHQFNIWREEQYKQIKQSSRTHGD